MNKFMTRVFSDPKFSAEAMEAVEKAQTDGESTLGEDIKMTKDEDGNVIVSEGEEKTKVSQNPNDENDLQLADVSEEVEETPEENPEAPTEEVEENETEEVEEKTESEAGEVEEAKTTPDVTIKVAGREVKVFSDDEDKAAHDQAIKDMEKEGIEVADELKEFCCDPEILKSIANKILEMAEDEKPHTEEEVRNECGKFCKSKVYAQIADAMISAVSEDAPEDQEEIKQEIEDKVEEMANDDVDHTEEEVHEECGKCYSNSFGKSARMYSRYASELIRKFSEDSEEDQEDIKDEIRDKVQEMADADEDYTEEEVHEECGKCYSDCGGKSARMYSRYVDRCIRKFSEDLEDEDDSEIKEQIADKVQEMADSDDEFTEEEVHEECGKCYSRVSSKKARMFSRYVDRCIRMFSGSDTEGKAEQTEGEVEKPETMEPEVSNDFHGPEEGVAVTETKSETDPEPEVIPNETPDEPMSPNNAEEGAEPFDEEQKRNFSACLTMEFGHVKQHNPVNEHLQMRQDKTAPKQKLFSVMTPDSKVSNPCLTCTW